MIKSLIAKEINITSIGSKFKKENLLNTIIELVLYVGFIAIEVYLFHMLSSKLNSYVGVARALLTIFLTIISAVLIVVMTTQARKSIFSVEDANIMLTKPIKPMDNILSKILFIYAKNVFFNFCVAFPILVSYVINVGAPVYLVAICLLYPFIASCFETGFACILSLPLQKTTLVLKRVGILQVVFSIAIIFGFCYLYSHVLNLFMVLVKDGNIETIFTNDTLEILKKVGEFCIPARFFVPMFEGKAVWILVMLAISIVIFVLGVALGSVFYLKFIKDEKESRDGQKKKFKPTKSVVKALFVKEFKLIFSSNSVFSFAGLLFMQPILTFAIVKAINVIFKSGVFSFLSSMFTFLVPIVGVLFVTLFSVIINTSSSFILQKEGYSGIKICKLIPVAYKQQVFIKMIVPFVSSVLSLLVTVIVLVAFKELGVVNGVLSFFLALVLEIIMEMVCVSAEFRNKSKGEGSSLAAVVEIVSIAVPLVLVAFIGVLAYVGLNFYIAFAIPLALALVVAVVYGILFAKNINKNFILLETRN